VAESKSDGTDAAKSGADVAKTSSRVSGQDSDGEMNSSLV